VESLAWLQQRILDAAQHQIPLRLRGSGSKDFYGEAARGEALDVSVHQGIVSYEPTELVITAKAGTALSLIEQSLAEHRQMLAFEPPHLVPRPRSVAWLLPVFQGRAGQQVARCATLYSA